MHKNPEIKMVAIESIKPYDKNAKLHSEEQIEKIIAQIRKMGFNVPLVVNSKDKMLVSGHGRRLAALKMGLKEVPVIYRALSKENAAAARLADNKIAEMPWNEDLLKAELALLDQVDFDLSLTGFSEKELDILLQDDPGDLAGEAEETAAEEISLPEMSHVKMLQLYLNDETYPEIVQKIYDLQKYYGTGTITDTIMALVRENHTSKCPH